MIERLKDKVAFAVYDLAGWLDVKTATYNGPIATEQQIADTKFLRRTFGPLFVIWLAFTIPALIEAVNR